MFPSIVDTTITSLSDLQCGNGRDPATNCTQCLQGRDPATNCTQCLQGRDSANCMQCLQGRDPANCMQCLQGRDPATDCVMCLPGTYRVSAEAMECTALPGIQLSSYINNYKCSIVGYRFWCEWTIWCYWRTVCVCAGIAHNLHCCPSLPLAASQKIYAITFSNRRCSS